MLIPKKIFQTFETTQLPEGMSKACLSWKIKNPDWQYYFFDKNDRVEFIKKHFTKDVLEAYYWRKDLTQSCILFNCRNLCLVSSINGKERNEKIGTQKYY